MTSCGRSVRTSDSQSQPVPCNLESKTTVQQKKKYPVTSATPEMHSLSGVTSKPSQTMNLHHSPESDMLNTPSQKSTPPQDKQMVCLAPARAKTLSKIKPHKAAGPDNIPVRVLMDCAEELKDVITDIFNSLRQAVVPMCFKATTMIPVPKEPHLSSHNDYLSIALTFII